MAPWGGTAIVSPASAQLLLDLTLHLIPIAGVGFNPTLILWRSEQAVQHRDAYEIEDEDYHPTTHVYHSSDLPPVHMQPPNLGHQISQDITIAEKSQKVLNVAPHP